MSAEDEMRVTPAPYTSKAFGFLGLMAVLCVLAVVVGAAAAGFTWLVVQTLLAVLELATGAYGGSL